MSLLRPTTSSLLSSISRPIARSVIPDATLLARRMGKRPMATNTSSETTPKQSTTIPSSSDAGDKLANGVSGFLDSKSINDIEKVQADLWRRLEGEMKNQPDLEAWMNTQGSTFDIASLITYTARDPKLSLAYNYATLILNNSYFLEGISGAKSQVPPMHQYLEDMLVGRARGMVGSGWLWLVKSNKQASNLSIDVLPTYASGTLLVRNASQQGREGSLSPYRPSSSPSSIPSTRETQTNSVDKQYGQNTQSVVTPLAVISLFEHAYMGTEKYGATGREEYVRDWLKHLDWEKIKNQL